MRILVDLNHPGHVHFYKHAIRNWRDRGHRVVVTARNKDVTLPLLESFQLDYVVTSRVRRGQAGLAIEFVEHEWNLWRTMGRFAPDVMTGIGGAFIAPAAKLAGVPSVVFTDSEHVSLDRYLTYPLASAICTPECFKKDIGPNQLRYQGFQELAYLDPRYFVPDSTVLTRLDLAHGDRFAVIRFVGWTASHDIGHKGFTSTQKARLISELSQEGRVLVSAERGVPEEFRRYEISAVPEEIHNLLYYASLYVGEGATMATEAGLLGTPSVYVSTLVGTMGNYEELERYGLVEAYHEGDNGVQRAIALMKDAKAEHRWQKARQWMLQNTLDVTAFVTETVEQYGRGKSSRS